MNTIIEPAYADLEPRELWRHFSALNRIPRASGREAAARAYVQHVAETANATAATDEAGNIIVSVPARGAQNDAPVVAVQSHLDMVCEKRPDVEHDFSTDPILPRRVGDRIFASGTTLGADNGIGAAAALALLTEPNLRHGPLELVFTVAEETGLDGAMALDPALLRAEMLINLDSEDPDELTIGCAGGAGTMLHFPLRRETSSPDWMGFEITVSGLQGGHSGIQIHEPLANAIKLLAQVLLALRDADVDFYLSTLSGGSAHNAIPRDAVARLAVAPASQPAFETIVSATRDALKSEWLEHEPELALQWRNIESPSQIIGLPVQESLLRLLDELPHGIIEMSQTFSGKVQTSTNLAGVETRRDDIEIATNSRSFIATKLQQLQEHIQKIGLACGAEIEVRAGYPGWEPEADSRLQQVAAAAYEKVYGKPAKIEVVHAGLECGVIVSKKPGLQAISFGPLIRAPHTPEEFVQISTVEPTWKLLTTLLADLSAPQLKTG